MPDFPYEKYRGAKEWSLIETAVQELEKNKDLTLTTDPEYVIGYLTKSVQPQIQKNDLRVLVLLSASRALLGAVNSNLRGVALSYDPKKLVFRAYFEANATEDEKEQLNIALTEMMADLDSRIEEFDFEPIVLPFPEKMEPLQDWVFLRAENMN